MLPLLASGDTVTLSTSVAIGLGGALVGGAVAWGVLRTTVHELRDLVHALRAEIASLKTEVGTLGRNVAILQDRSDRQPTGGHAAVHP